MTPSDLALLHAAAFSQSRPWSAAEFESLLASDLCFACMQEHGFALGRVIADEAELLTIAVHPEAQGAGIGKKLMSEFHTAAKSRGASRAFLEVADDNGAARALYLGTGYGESGRRVGYYNRAHSAPIDAITMERAL